MVFKEIQQTYPGAELEGSSLKLDYCELGNAIALLKEQYVMGTVEVKIVS